MAEFLSQFSIQRWLEMCPQGYLEDTVYGRGEGETEPEQLVADQDQLEAAIRAAVQLVVVERAALAASSGLVNAAPDDASKRFLATQTLDEAGHVEIFTLRLYDLGVKQDDLASTITQFVNPHLVTFADVLLEKVDSGDFVAGVVGQNLVLEGVAFTVFEMLETGNRELNPKFAHTLSGTIADERRHVGFGENRIGSLIRQYPEKKPEVERIQQEMTFHMLNTTSSSFESSPPPQHDDGGVGADFHGTDLATATPEQMQNVLAGTVLDEFKTRLTRVGIDDQAPTAPV